MIITHTHTRTEIDKKQIPLDAQVFSLWADDPENLLELRISVTATEGLYKGIPLVFEIHIPSKDEAMYPNHQPEVNLVPGYRIIHPNINYDGKACLGYRRENPWKATMGLKTSRGLSLEFCTVRTLTMLRMDVRILQER